MIYAVSFDFPCATEEREEKGEREGEIAISLHRMRPLFGSPILSLRSYLHTVACALLFQVWHCHLATVWLP